MGRWVTLGVGLAVLGGCGEAGPPQVVRLAFRKGARARYETQVTLESRSYGGDVADSSGEMSTRMTLWTEAVVEDVVAERGVVSLTVTRLMMSMRGPGGMHLDFDSADEDGSGGEMGALGALVGKKHLAVIDARGQVVESAPDAALLEQFEAQMGPGSWNQMMLGQVPLPAEAVAVGDTWAGRLRPNLGPLGELDVAVASELGRLQDGVARIEQVLDVDAGPLPGLGGVTVEFERFRAWTEFHLDEGLQGDAELEGQVRMHGGPGGMPSQLMTLHTTTRRVDG